MTYSEKLKDPRWQNRSGIYKLTIADEIYIGSAASIPRRLKQHLNALVAARHCNIHLQRAYDKYGAIDCDVLELVDALDCLIEREQYFIDVLKPRYNIAPRAGSQLGFRHSAESRARIAAVQKGRKMPEHQRLAMSAARRGQKFTKEHRENIARAKVGAKNPFYKAGSRHPQFGIPKSTVTRTRISATSRARGSHKGENNAASRTGVVYDVETGANYLFRSLKPFCAAVGLPYKSVVSAQGQARFFRDRFYCSYVDLPDGVATRIPSPFPGFSPGTTS